MCQATLTEQQEDIAPTTIVKKPNPQNQNMQSALEELEGEIKRYSATRSQTL